MKNDLMGDIFMLLTTISFVITIGTAIIVAYHITNTGD
jgi:hypothetical protein